MSPFQQSPATIVPIFKGLQEQRPIFGALAMSWQPEQQQTGVICKNKAGCNNN